MLGMTFGGAGIPRVLASLAPLSSHERGSRAGMTGVARKG